MAIRTFGTPETDPGQWTDYLDAAGHPVTNDGRPVRKRVRRVPPSVEKRLSQKKFDVKHLRGSKDSVVTIDAEEADRTARDRAAWALTGLENYAVIPGDKAAAAKLSELSGRAIGIDEELVLDDCLTPEMKGHLLTDIDPQLRADVLAEAERLGIVAAGEEVGKGKT